MNPILFLYQQFLFCPKVSTDSRNIPPNAIFFALKGDHFDGNKYAFKALEKGAALAVVDDRELAGHEKIIVVDDVLETLQKLARHHRNNLKTKIIGITGSNGKTTTKELINAVLGSAYRTMATLGNLNNHIGVPLTLLSFPSDLDFAIVEMGANHIGEIALLSDVADPDFGIITNVGRAHLEGFGSLEGVIKAKTELYGHIMSKGGTLFVNSNNEILVDKSKSSECYFYGGQKDEVYGEILEQDSFLKLKFTIGERKMNLTTKLVGAYNLENIVAAVAIGHFFGLAPEAIQSAIENYIPSNNRSQVQKTANNTLILDAYNANPSSMEAALRNFAGSNYNNKMLILGEMLELGVEAKNEHNKLVQLVKELGFKNVLLVGQNYLSLDKTPFIMYKSTHELAEGLDKNRVNNYTILIKGSRGNKLEALINLL